jgi:hypothetical protein
VFCFIASFFRDGCPQKKHEGTNGVAAFVGLRYVPPPLGSTYPNINPPFSAPSSIDELFKSSAYLTEAYVLNDAMKYSTQPTETPFNFAFGTKKVFLGGWRTGRRRERVRSVKRVCGLRGREGSVVLWI